MFPEVISSPKVPDMIHVDLGVGTSDHHADTVIGSHQAAPRPSARSFDLPAAKPSDMGEMPRVPRHS